MLPFCLGACVASFIVGFLVNILGDVRRIMAVSFVRIPVRQPTLDADFRNKAVMALGFGLMIMLTNTSSM